MKQYNSIKTKYPDALLLFRVGDFYETFGSDAITAAGILGIVLTKRANGSASSIELAGFPHHSLDTYLPKLVRAGQRVAICEQLEDPKTTKTIVKRGVTELITPGLAANEKMLDHKSNNFLAVLHFDEDQIGLALLDYSTGEFLSAQGDQFYIDKLLQSYDPSEVVYCKKAKKNFDKLFADQYYSYPIDEWIFNDDYANEILLRQFETNSLKGFGIEEMELAIIAAGAALHYLGETNNEHLEHISNISRIDRDQHMWLDKFSIRNLELIGSPHPGAKTLFDILDDTLSPMGARMLKKWIVFPLINQSQINERLSLVEHFIKFQDLSEKYAEHIKQCGDLERIISRLAMRRIGPRELVQLKRSLQQVAPIKKIGAASKLPALKKIADQLNNCETLIDLISNSIN
ncbi:MAG: DNA mismatch repair protein MutS, partial [Bacteroidia bacterium]|nr:DNA mismatch repair protein MutS [Bacteroidia bacterium]